MLSSRFRVDWSTVDGALAATEPTLAEVTACAADLAAAYNQPHNAKMMGHDEPFTPADVVAHHAAMLAEGARPFLLHRDEVLAGDADLRHIVREAGGAHAEVALMVGAPSAQGRGLGTRFAIMVHAVAFSRFGLERLFVAIVPANTASLRLFTKLGYRVDTTPLARSCVDDVDDVAMSVARADFERAQGASLAEIKITER